VFHTLTFRQSQRVRLAADFISLKAIPTRWEGHHFFIKYGFLPRNGNEYQGPRIAFIVSKKIGPSCFRHKIKRLAREIFRLHQHELPKGIDLLWVARRGISDQWEALHREFQSMIPKLQQHLKSISKAKNND
jgi:ribonuclease P protein component